MHSHKQHFVVVQAKRHLSQMRLSLVLGIMFFALFAFFDYHIFPHQFDTLLAVRFGSLPLAALLLIPLTYHRRFARWAPKLLAAGVIVGALGLTLLQLVTPAPYNGLYFAGMLVLLFFCYGVLMIPFLEALFAGIVSTVLHCGILAVLGDQPAMVQLAEAFILVSVNIAGAVVVSYRDRIERRAFDAKHRIALQNGELLRSKQYLEERVLDRTRDLQETNHRLHRALEERTQLIQEVYHRVGNNLQMIGSLFRLEASNDAIPPEEKLGRMEARLRTMASVHALVYDAGDYSEVSLNEVIRGLEALASDGSRRNGGARRIRVTGDELHLGLEQAVPAALLVNELLSIGCGEGETGPVSVSVSTLGGNASILVEGVGWDEGRSRISCKDELRAHLVSALVSQVGGAVGCEENSGQVTTIFPVNASYHSVSPNDRPWVRQS